MMKRVLSVKILILLSVAALFAQQSQTKSAIVRNIESSSKVKVHQDPKIEKILDSHIEKKEEKETTPAPYTGYGYRVQVFSSNNQQTGRSQATSIERRVRSSFPQVGVYRTYSSPFWKVRVGDFRNEQDAQAFRSELIRTFPDLRGEMYVVRENKVTIR